MVLSIDKSNTVSDNHIQSNYTSLKKIPKKNFRSRISKGLESSTVQKKKF